MRILCAALFGVKLTFLALYYVIKLHNKGPLHEIRFFKSFFQL